MDSVVQKVKATPKHIWILVVIMIVGIFLRTYNFHDWLKFREDQKRDATLVSEIIAGEKPWPLTGPYMSYSGDGDHVETNSYHIGPAYYYFQITSAKIFGDKPESVAFPDLFFGILTIPLLYVFLRKYFSENISLSVAGIFAVSSYFIEYSRFAWNTNLIPFFVLLFLWSLTEFLEKNEKASWLSAASAGIAMGIGIQLHVLLLIFFGAVGVIVFLMTVRKNWRVLSRWALVAALFLLLNIPQIITETKTNFSNTKILLGFNSKPENPNEPKPEKLELIRNDLDCHLEASAFYLSAFGSSNCSYDMLTPSAYGDLRTKKFSQTFDDLVLRATMLVKVAFFFFGIYLFCLAFKKEKQLGKKSFLQIIGIYLLVAWIMMIPLSIDKFNDLRYYTPSFFAGFVFLALLLEFLQNKFAKKYIYFAAAILAILVLSNIFAIGNVVQALVERDRTCSSHSTTLGELEPVAAYLMKNSGGKKELFFGGDKSLRVVYGPLSYLVKRAGYNSQEVDVENRQFPEGAGPVYGVSCKQGMTAKYPYEKINNFYVYKIN